MHHFHLLAYNYFEFSKDYLDYLAYIVDNLGRNVTLYPSNNIIDTSAYPLARFGIIKYETKDLKHYDTNIIILPNSENHIIMMGGSNTQEESVNLQWFNHKIIEAWHLQYGGGTDIKMKMTQVLLFF